MYGRSGRRELGHHTGARRVLLAATREAEDAARGSKASSTSSVGNVVVGDKADGGMAYGAIAGRGRQPRSVYQSGNPCTPKLPPHSLRATPSDDHPTARERKQMDRNSPMSTRSPCEGSRIDLYAK